MHHRLSRCLELVEYTYGPELARTRCGRFLRSLFIAAPGKVLISSGLLRD